VVASLNDAASSDVEIAFLGYAIARLAVLLGGPDFSKAA
jgi:hypothetical protein